MLRICRGEEEFNQLVRQPDAAWICTWATDMGPVFILTALWRRLPWVSRYYIIDKLLFNDVLTFGVFWENLAVHVHNLDRRWHAFNSAWLRQSWMHSSLIPKGQTYSEWPGCATGRRCFGHPRTDSIFCAPHARTSLKRISLYFFLFFLVNPFGWCMSGIALCGLCGWM